MELVEESPHNSEDEIDRSVPATPRRLSEHLEPSLGSGGSFAWNHFTKDKGFKNNKKATCNHCHRSYVCSGGSTSGITKHLKNVHNLVPNSSNPPIGETNVLNMLQTSRVNYYYYFYTF
jgi:hypothetical protein